MGKIAEHPVTKILNLIESLSTDEKRIIYDRVRPAPKPRQKGKNSSSKLAQKRKAQSITPTVVTKFDNNCANCKLPFDDNTHHIKSSPNYHEFAEPVGEAGNGCAWNRTKDSPDVHHNQP